MKVLETALPGVLVLEPAVHGDARGFFMESWHADRYREHGLPERFVQDNVSRSQRGVLRGLHFQNPYPQGKLVCVLDGEVYDVVVDIRVGSPTFGRWTAATLSAGNHRQLYCPPGFAHGFCVVSEYALFTYKCTEYYHPETEATVRWDDPDLAIPWPVDDPQLSVKDVGGARLRDVPPDRLPRYGEPAQGRA